MKSLLELVDMEIRDLAEQIRVRRRQRYKLFAVLPLKHLEDDESDLGLGSIQKLMDAIDSEIAEPVRDVDKPLLMAVEDVFTITGRGTVATGRIERGIVKVGEEMKLLDWVNLEQLLALVLRCSAKN